MRDDLSTLDKLSKNKQKPITIEQGQKLARDSKAEKYCECSALTQVRIWYEFLCIHTVCSTVLNKT